MRVLLILLVLTVSLSIAREREDWRNRGQKKCNRHLAKIVRCQKKGWITDHPGYSCNNKPKKKPMKEKKAYWCKHSLHMYLKMPCSQALCEGCDHAVECSKKDVRIVAIYELDAGRTRPPYDLDATVTGLDYVATLADAMRVLMDQGKILSWGETFSTEMGLHLIDFNRMEANRGTQYWQILGGDDMGDIIGGHIGIHSYHPKDGETVLFRFKTWDNDYGSANYRPG